MAEQLIDNLGRSATSDSSDDRKLKMLSVKKPDVATVQTFVTACIAV